MYEQLLLYKLYRSFVSGLQKLGIEVGTTIVERLNV